MVASMSLPSDMQGANLYSSHGSRECSRSHFRWVPLEPVVNGAFVSTNQVMKNDAHSRVSCGNEGQDDHLEAFHHCDKMPKKQTVK